MRTVERVSISAFVDQDDHERLVERARAEERSVSAELRLAIREHLSSGAVKAAGAFEGDDGTRRPGWSKTARACEPHSA